jgi:multicomponent Na+:H+ antiporter subunit F
MLDHLLFPVALAILAVSALLALLRLIRGPTLPDRVVALDLIGVLVVGFAVTSAAVTGSSFFLDVAIVIALLSFVGTIAYSRYIETVGRS